MRIGPALGRLLPLFAVGAFVLVVGATLAVAGDTLGYDFLAYHAAARRVLDGLPAYDMSFEAAGGFGLFYYPPTFLPFVLPFALLPAATATVAWVGVLLASFAAGVAAMPVSARARWVIVLLAGLSWPFAYAMKLGQVGPLLFLAFAVGWRFLERPAVAGIAGAIGAAIKIQPGVVIAWALVAGRWRMVAWGAAALVVIAAIATALAGVGAWTDFLELIRRVSDPISTPHNFTPGAVAYQAGVAAGTAQLIQLAAMGVTVLALVVAGRRLAPVPGFLVAVVASQLLSPILWDHYALLLLLPVAWLLDRGHWWAVLIPLVTSIFLVGVIPPVVYPLAFAVTLVALLAVGRQSGSARAGRSA